jgi:hypothetical protein
VFPPTCFMRHGVQRRSERSNPELDSTSDGSDSISLNSPLNMIVNWMEMRLLALQSNR